MKLTKFLQWLKALPPAGRRSLISAGDETPLRSELLSTDQMEQHGKALAASHRLATGRALDRLLPRLSENERALIEVCDLLTAEVTAKHRITPAGEWLLDNFYLIEEQIRTAKRHLPKGYSRELPRLAHGPSAGRPRVYDIALETISHGDGRVDAETFSRFVAAYQTVTPLKLGELWAVPIMLRLAVIENLRRVGMRIAAGWVDRNLANSWADQMRTNRFSVRVLVPTLCVGTDTGDAPRPIGHKSKMGNQLAIPSTQSFGKLRSHAERGNECFCDLAILQRSDWRSDGKIGTIVESSPPWGAIFNLGFPTPTCKRRGRRRLSE